MSKRTDKKRQKRFNEVHPTTTAPAAQPVVETAAPTAEPVPEVTVTETTAPVNAAPAYDLFIQYQNGEYDAAVLAEKILDKCKAEGMDSSDLKIYVKPEDKKAYYACAGGTGAIVIYNHFNPKGYSNAFSNLFHLVSDDFSSCFFHHPNIPF